MQLQCDLCGPSGTSIFEIGYRKCYNDISIPFDDLNFNPLRLKMLILAREHYIIKTMPEEKGMFSCTLLSQAQNSWAKRLTQTVC